MHKLLAFYINDSLDDAERRTVEQALADDAGLRREADTLRALRRGIQAQELPTPCELGLKRLQRDIQRRRKPASGRGWRLAAIAAGLLLTVQTAVIVTRAPSPGHYAPLSGSPSGPLSSAAVLQLGFSPGATAVDIASLLQSIDARIIDGPGANGLYRIALPQGEDAGQALAKLRAQPDIVAYAARE